MNLLLIIKLLKKNMYLNIGDKAPEFQLLNHENNLFSLDDFKNQKILIWFFPKANTPG